MKYQELDAKLREKLFPYVLFLGDSNLVLGHRLSQWCGHGPMLEEDIALTNMSLDCIGQASSLLKLAGEIENKNRSEDNLAYLRDALEFRNLIMLELPIGDFGFTIMRQFLYTTYIYLVYRELQKSPISELRAIVDKGIKEIKYHIRHSSEWVIRLGDGTEESHKRIQQSLNNLWPYTSEFFIKNLNDTTLVEEKIIADLSLFKDEWLTIVKKVCDEATLTVPEDIEFNYYDGRNSKHTEYLGHMLAEMQILPRSHPGATW